MRTSRLARPRWSPSLALCALGHFTALGVGCGDSPPTTAPSATSSAVPTTSAAATASAPKAIGPITVDNLGVFVSGQRATLDTPEGQKRLVKIIAELPLEGAEIEIVTLKKSKTRDVLALVAELAGRGVGKVKIRTDGRDDLPKELTVIPAQKLASSPEACSVVATLGDDLQTRVWSLQGGTAMRHKKGFAGPDFSNTATAATKQIARCKSDVAFFSGDPDVDWELTFNLGGTLTTMADPDKALKTLALLTDSPVAGKPVKVAP